MFATYTFPRGERLHRPDDYSSDSDDESYLTREPVSSDLADFQFESESKSEEAHNIRLAAEKAHPYIITSSTMTFEDIPSIYGVIPIKRSFYYPSKGWEENGTITDKPWKEIKKIITQILKKYNIPFCLPEAVGVFSVSINPTDRDTRLIFDIYCCLKEDKSGFVIEFRRLRGSYDTISSVIQDVRDQLESPRPDPDTEALGSSMQYNIPESDKNRYQGEHFDFDSLIKPKK